MVRIIGYKCCCTTSSIYFILIGFILIFLTYPISSGLPSSKKTSVTPDSCALKSHPTEFIVKFHSKINCHIENGIVVTHFNRLDSLFRIYKVTHFKALFPNGLIHDKNARTKGYQRLNDLSNIYRFSLAKPRDLTKLLVSLQKIPTVVYAEPNYFYYSNTSSEIPSFIEPSVLKKIQLSPDLKVGENDSLVVIGIIHTGMAEASSAISDMIWRNAKEIPGNGIDDDGNGFIDDIRGWDFVSVDSIYAAKGEDAEPPDCNPSDYDGYGTLMAKIIKNVIGQALDNSNNNKIRLMPIRAGFKSRTQISLFKADDCAEAIYYAVEKHASIVQLSWGGPHFSHLLQDVISYADNSHCIIIAAAGNENSVEPHYPAAYPAVWAIAATDLDDKKAALSNYGTWITISAPGSQASRAEGHLERFSTSIAASMVTGLATLLLVDEPEVLPDTLKKRLVCSAENIDSLNPDYDGLLGAGRINAWRALNNIKQSNLTLRSTQIKELTGNANQRFDPGETVELIITLQNIAYDAQGVWLELQINDHYVSCANPSQVLGPVAYLDSVDNVSDPFIIIAESNCPESHTVVCFLHISDQADFRKTLSIPIGIGIPAPATLSAAIVQDEGAILLSWQYHLNERSTGFDIYRKTFGSEKFDKINESIVLTNFFVDRTVKPFSTYIYSIRALDDDGASSRLSIPDTIMCISNEKLQFVDEQKRVSSVDSSGFLPKSTDDQYFKSRNSPPQILHAFPAHDTTIFEGDTLKFKVEALDPEGDSLYIVWRTQSFPDSTTFGARFVFAPGFLFARQDTIQVYISDGDTTIAHFWFITIKDVIQLPQIVTTFPPGDTTISEGDSLMLTISAIDLDSDSRNYHWLINGIADTSQLDSFYTMKTDFKSAGVDTILVKIIDRDTSIVHSWYVTIQNVNQLPEIGAIFPSADTTVQEGDSLKFICKANDPDGDSLRYTWSINGVSDSSYNDTTFYFITNKNSDGVDTIQTVVSDADSFITHQWVVTIQNLNSSPVLAAYSPAVDSLLISEGDSIKFSMKAIDSDHDSLSFIWLTTSTKQDTIQGDSVFWYVTDYFSAGIDSITGIVTDDDTSISQRWIVKIVNINQAPVITYTWPDSNITVMEGDTILFKARFLEPDSQDVQTLWFVNGTHDTTGTDSSLQFIAELDPVGKDSITFVVLDSDTMIWRNWLVSVIKFNYMPEIMTYSPHNDTSLIEGDTLIFRLHANDIDGDSLFFKWSINGSIDSTEIDSQFILITDFNSAGIDTVQGWVSDGDTSVFQQWLVTIINQNRSPEAPELLHPIKGERVSETDELSWMTAFDPDIEDSTLSYLLEVSLDSSFQRIVSQDTSLEEAFITLNQISGFDSLISGEQYYWRVKTTDSDGDSSAFSTSVGLFVFYIPSVKISRQYAQVNEDGSITIFWETEFEYENLGFNIYRASSQNGPFLQLNQTLIRGNGSYSFLDTDIKAGVTYYYEVENMSESGYRSRFTLVSIKAPVPEQFELFQNYPNPFNVDTFIRYQIPRDCHVLLTVHNILGRGVRTLVDKNQKPGFYNAYWDGKDNRGRDVGSGIYFYNIYADEFHQTRKLVVVR